MAVEGTGVQRPHPARSAGTGGAYAAPPSGACGSRLTPSHPTLHPHLPIFLPNSTANQEDAGAAAEFEDVAWRVSAADVAEHAPRWVARLADVCRLAGKGELAPDREAGVWDAARVAVARHAGGC